MTFHHDTDASFEPIPPNVERAGDGLSPDEPTEQEALEMRLASLISIRERMLNVNSLVRNKNTRRLHALGYSAEQIEGFYEPTVKRQGGAFPAYKITRLDKQIMDAKAQLRQYSGTDSPPTIVQAAEYTYEANPQERTVSFTFAAKPSKEVRRNLRAEGFLRAGAGTKYRSRFTPTALLASRRLCASFADADA